MTLAIAYKLLAIFATVALGWIAGRLRWLHSGTDTSDSARVLSNAAFSIFVPALLFRTTARLDFATLPPNIVAAFFLPVLVMMLGVYAWQRASGAPGRHGTAAPSVRALSVSFGNSVQIGIPLAAALFGEAGLAIHVALVSLHALILLSVLTVIVELDLARARARHESSPSFWSTMRTTVRHTIIHPVVLPVVAGLLWNATGVGLHPVVDESLSVLGAAVVPLCLVLVGLTLAHYGIKGHLRGAIGISLLKLIVLPALVLVTARWGFGLGGVPLAVVVVMAALPVGTNPLIFSQRYDTLQAEATATIVFSTLAFAVTAPLWLAILHLIE